MVGRVGHRWVARARLIKRRITVSAAARLRWKPRISSRSRVIGVHSTIATSHTEDAIASGSTLPFALVDGFTTAFVAGVIVAALGIVASLTLIRRDELEQAPVAEPAFDLAA